MTYGADGMWYRAASYATKEQCLEALQKIKSALAARPSAGDNLLTISFETPKDKKYVMALGYPEPETIALAESLFEQPPVTLSTGDLTYARHEVAKLRRSEGISDEEAGARALAQARNLGIPEPLAQSIAEEYIHDQPETASRAPLSKIAPGSPVYKVDRKDVPREVRPQLARVQEEGRRKARERTYPFFIRFRYHIEEIAKEDKEGFDLSIIIYMQQLRFMFPYLFTSSAMQLFQTVLDSSKNDFPIPEHDVWIEFQTPVETPHGRVKAFAIAKVNNRTLLEQIEHKYPKIPLTQFEDVRQKPLYRVQIIDNDMQFIATEHYNRESLQWVYPPDRECPTHQCLTEKRGEPVENMTVHPCSSCKACTSFWASWTRTLLLILEREYAISPEPQPWETQTMTYEEEAIKKVGHGKNTREIKTTFKREVEYRIVSFDVSIPAPQREHAAQEARTNEEKQPNWLTLHGKEDLIYRRVHFEDVERHYTQHKHLLQKCLERGGTFAEKDGDIEREYHIENRPDGTQAVVSKLVPFAKYVPMLREKKPVIRKVIAGAYEQERK